MEASVSQHPLLSTDDLARDDQIGGRLLTYIAEKRRTQMNIHSR